MKTFGHIVTILLETSAAVSLYKLMNPGSGPHLWHFGHAVVLERISDFWGLEVQLVEAVKGWEMLWICT